MNLMQNIFEWATTRNTTVSASYIPRVDNIMADTESRKENRDAEWMLHRNLFIRVCVVYDIPDIDLFASRLTYQVRLYVAWRPDPGVCYIDAFTISWKHQLNYMFSPFSLMGCMLRTLTLQH